MRSGLTTLRLFRWVRKMVCGIGRSFGHLLLTALVTAAGPWATAQTTARISQPVSSFESIFIAGQEWMSENLQVTTFRDGTPIPLATTAEEWLAAYRSETAAWCYYNNDSTDEKLYNWYAVNDPRGLAPKGFHIPTDREFKRLIESSGGGNQAFERLSTTGGFAGKPSGARYYKDASFNHKGTVGFWWSATRENKWNAWYLAMHFGYKQVARSNGGMNTGHSIRCVRD
jgi:uncharacterized protein (TIGR02145 family)